MNILQTLQRLRDDIRAWVTLNIEALNEKIDKKTIVDSKLDPSSANPVQNKVITKAINNVPKFSGDYNDLTNAPNIAEDGSGNMIIVDELGNVIFKVDSEGTHTTALSLDGAVAATENYVVKFDSTHNIFFEDITVYSTTSIAKPNNTTPATVLVIDNCMDMTFVGNIFKVQSGKLSNSTNANAVVLR